MSTHPVQRLMALALQVRLSLAGPTRPGWPRELEATRLTMKLAVPVIQRLPVRWQREAAERLLRGQGNITGVRSEKVELAGIPGERFLCDAADTGQQLPVLLYLHGGGYCVGSVNSHRMLLGSLARVAGARVDAIEYRLAPEHPFPAPIEDSVAAYQALLDEGIAASRIVIAGDSAGGGLTLATLVKLRDLGIPLPAGGVAISPWADMEALGASMQGNADSDYLTRYQIRHFAKRYLAGADPRDPLAAPMYADYRGLPPLLVQAGGGEVLLDDALRVAASAREAGVQVDLQVEPDMPHVWHMYSHFLPQGRRATMEIGRFIKRRTGTN